MERLSESRAREGCRKRRDGETIEYFGYLREKREVDMRVTEHQVDLKRREVCIERRRVWIHYAVIEALQCVEW